MHMPHNMNYMNALSTLTKRLICEALLYNLIGITGF